MDEKQLSFEEKKLSFETDFEEEEENRLKIRPEDIIRAKEISGVLPEEYNPYGKHYSITKSKFLGDTPPCPQFKEDGSRAWEVMNNGDPTGEKDPDLTPVYFSLPQPPELTLIDGYGLDRDEQYFKRQEIPRKFKLIEAKALRDLADIEKKNRQETVQGYKFYIRFWEIVEEEQDNLEKEIEWLKRVWWHRTYGYWYYNDGEPTFLPPDYYDFLEFYYIAEALCYPEYRDDVRRKYDYAWYLEDCTETFKTLDETGTAVKNKDGEYEMVDLGRRLFFGDCEPKTRRTGATHEAIHKLKKGATTNLSHFNTIISFEGDNAKIHYEKKLLPAFDADPMCLKPMWQGNRRPTILRLDAPPNVYRTEGLGSSITYSDSGGMFKNDGDRLNGVLNDEQGKSVNSTADIFERWHVNKYTMSTGMGVNILKGSYVKNPSTVEQLEAGSVPYYKMCMMSDFYRRIPIKGQTQEGFARIFLPAFLRLEGYIDRFGKSVINTPTERQRLLSPNAIFSVSGKGARETMQAERDALLQINTPESLEAYRSLRRKSPFFWSECWLGSGGNVGINLEIIDASLARINKEKSLGRPPYRQGYFYRENSADLNSKVLWRDDSNKVKFLLSMILPDNLSNQRIQFDRWDNTKNQFVPAWKPINGHKFTIGADPFRNMTKNEAKSGVKYGGSRSNSRQSDGGIGVNWEYDASIDAGKPRKEWDSDRCVCSYRYRTESQMEYMEDVIMCMQYFGGMLYPETNVERLVEHIIQRGYFGYLLYDTDIMTGKPKGMPGRYTTGDTLQELLVEAKDYIEFRGHKEVHDDLLLECKSLRGVEDFTYKDLMVAYFFARLGSKSRHRDIISKGQVQPTISLGDIGMFRKRRI